MWPVQIDINQCIPTVWYDSALLENHPSFKETSEKQSPCGSFRMHFQEGLFLKEHRVKLTRMLIFTEHRSPCVKIWVRLSWHQQVSRYANPQPWAPRRAVITTFCSMYLVWPDGDRTRAPSIRGGRSTTTSLRQYHQVKEDKWYRYSIFNC